MSDPIRTIVAGVSHPSGDDPTLIAAAELARWTGARLRLVHAFALDPLLGPPNAGHAAPEEIQRHADELRTALESAARRIPGGEAAVCRCVPGAPGPAIVAAAAEAGADLVLVGAARAGWLARAFLGSTAQRVLRGASAPVLVVRRPPHRPLERVLLTTDLSALSAAVHERALDTAAWVFGEPRAARSLYVAEVPVLPPMAPSESFDGAARAATADFLRARRPRATPVEPAVRAGAYATEIVGEAAGWGADLLVVGTHARGWAARLALGSVAEAALREAPCNVLAIPPRAVAPELAAAGESTAGTAAGVEPIPA